MPAFPVISVPLRPGVTLTSEGAHFCIFSRHAIHVDLCLYDPKDETRETARIRMVRQERDLWHTFVSGVRSGQLYGYRAHGPWLPQNALRYNPNKLLLDPYAKAIVGKPDGRTGMLGGRSPNALPGAYDNGAEALKCAVVDESFDWEGDAHPRTSWSDTILYELHVKGFTQLHPKVPKELRGTYAGLAHPAVISYLKELGVTSLQFLPVHQHLDDQFLVEKGLTNYWGYNTIGFFAPHNEYASNHDPADQVREFKQMVKALHASGLEVILDVVYNHTAEGDERGPTLLFRGLDDRLYYRHVFDERGANYINITGCGNAVDSATPPTLQLILDSLRYWVTEMHVDGFRFDLAVTVARDHHDNFDANSQFLAAIAQDPVLSQVKLIAEPWDIFRMDSYQVGGFPEPWRELNGKYRDAVRKFWAGDEGTTAEFSKRLSGSQDVFGWNQRPALSINFLTSHDGFTLLDLVSYASKHNEANGEDNRDGDNDNHSVSCGVEGPSKDSHVNILRGRLRRSLLATLMTSVGVPFINAGDERGRTQKGNNNAYCQDNELSWMDWSSCDIELLSFTQKIIALRKRMTSLRRTGFYDGRVDPTKGIADVTWLQGDSSLLCHEEWHDPKRCSFGALLDGEPALLLLFNRGDQSQPFLMPGSIKTVWSMVFDTSLTPAFIKPDSFLVKGEEKYAIRSSSLVCFQLKSGPAMVSPHC
jgi:isoamylase